MNGFRAILILLGAVMLSPVAFGAQNGGTAPSRADLIQYVAQEATRQDLVAARLIDLIPQFEYMARDLASNGEAYDEMKTRTLVLGQRLQAAKTQHLEKARQLLRQALMNPAAGSQAVAEARRQVQEVRRELGSLLLQAGMSHAAEVFGVELRDTIDRQEDLQQITMDWEEALASSPASPRDLAPDQKDVGDRLGKLLVDVSSLSDVATDPVAYVRINRARKMIEQGGVVALTSSASGDVEKGVAAEAVKKQSQILRTLSEAEIKLRPGAELQALARARNQLKAILEKQKVLHRQVEGMTEAAFAAQAPGLVDPQDALRKPLRRIRAPISMDEPLVAAQAAIREAVQALGARKRPDTTAAQSRAEEALAQAIGLLEERITELQEIDRLYLRLQEAMNRLKTLQGLEERQTRVNDDTESLAGDKKNVDHLANPQDRLGIESEQFLGAMPAEGSKWLPLIRRPVERARKNQAEAAAALKQNQADKAKDPQTIALDGLHEAVEIAGTEVAYLEAVLRLKQLFGDMKRLAAHLKDIEDEQRDIRTDTEKAGAAGKTVLGLKSPQDTLVVVVDAAKDVAISFEALTLEAPLTDASQAMTAAAAQLTQDKAEGAVGPQKQAEAALRKAQEAALALAQAEISLADYLAMLEKIHADTLSLLQRQIVLRMETQKAEEKELPDLGGEQEILQAETTVFAEEFAIGPEHYRTAANEMGEAVKDLRAVQRNDALVHQVLAEEALKSALAEIVRLMRNIEQIDVLVKMPDMPPELSLILRAILLASDQGQLRTQTRTATPVALPALAPKEAALQEEGQSIAAAAEMFRELLDEAVREMGSATDTLKAGNRAESLTHERQAEMALRRWIAEMMIAAFALPTQHGVGLGVVMPSASIIGIPVEADKIFVKLSVEGETAARTRSEWEWLSQRDRAAINENFAPELPVEYRQVLKDYYEALSSEGPPSAAPTQSKGVTP